MKWLLAVKMAREQYDVTYAEWCDLYVNPNRPQHQKEKASETAHRVLVRNGHIEPSVVFEDGPQGW